MPVVIGNLGIYKKPFTTLSTLVLTLASLILTVWPIIINPSPEQNISKPQQNTSKPEQNDESTSSYKTLLFAFLAFLISIGVGFTIYFEVNEIRDIFEQRKLSEKDQKEKISKYISTINVGKIDIFDQTLEPTIWDDTILEKLSEKNTTIYVRSLAEVMSSNRYLFQYINEEITVEQYIKFIEFKIKDLAQIIDENKTIISKEKINIDKNTIQEIISNIKNLNTEANNENPNRETIQQNIGKIEKQVEKLEKLKESLCQKEKILGIKLKSKENGIKGISSFIDFFGCLKNKIQEGDIDHHKRIIIKEWGDSALSQILGIDSLNSRFILVNSKGPDDNSFYSYKRAEDDGVPLFQNFKYNDGKHPIVSMSQDLYQIIDRIYDFSERLNRFIGYYFVIVSENNNKQFSLVQIKRQAEYRIRYRGVGLNDENTQIQYKWNSTVASFHDISQDDRSHLMFFTKNDHIKVYNGNHSKLENWGTIEFNNSGKDGENRWNLGEGHFFDINVNEEVKEIAKRAQIELIKIDITETNNRQNDPKSLTLTKEKIEYFDCLFQNTNLHNKEELTKIIAELSKQYEKSLIPSESPTPPEQLG